MSKFENRGGGFITNESRTKGFNFIPDPTDVIISTAGKSGTTWMQQICHGLRSGGDMSFDEIDLVVPILEIAHDYGYDLDSPQSHVPRMFKTHQWYRDCPKGAGKYIVVVRYIWHALPNRQQYLRSRQPQDSVLSLYYHVKSRRFPNEELSFETFVRMWHKLEAPPDHLEWSSAMHHIMSWYPHRFDKNVLWLHYEDLKENLRECVRLVADFLDIGKGDDDLQELVTHQASLEFMLKHKNKFDSHHTLSARNQAKGLPKETGMDKVVPRVNVGESGRGKSVLSEGAIAFLDECWEKIIRSQTDYPDYDTFRYAINKELNRSFLLK